MALLTSLPQLFLSAPLPAVLPRRIGGLLDVALALIPLALGRGEPGKEIQAPLAIVVLGGLLTSTLLNMVVVPVLFCRWGGERDTDAQWRAA